MPKQIATVRNQDGTRKFKTPGELKLVLPPKCFYEQDIIKLALTASMFHNFYILLAFFFSEMIHFEDYSKLRKKFDKKENKLN